MPVQAVEILLLGFFGDMLMFRNLGCEAQFMFSLFKRKKFESAGVVVFDRSDIKLIAVAVYVSLSVFRI